MYNKHAVKHKKEACRVLLRPNIWAFGYRAGYNIVHPYAFPTCIILISKNAYFIDLSPLPSVIVSGFTDNLKFKALNC